MAILSSLFGPQQQQPAVGAQPITTTEIPTELKPYYTDILSKAQALYNKRVEEGFKPYEGPTVAQFTPEQEATFAGIAGLQGQVAPKFAEAEDLTRQAAAQITGEQLQEAMSPYQQAVTDIEKRESQKAFEQNVLPKLRAAQVAQGSFGGTRGTLLEAQAIADQQRALADIQAKGSAAAFKDARAALEAERTRMGQGATQLANIAPQALKTGLQELGAQQTVGETKQRQAQTALDEAYRQFLQEKQEPYEAMQKYQAVVTGAPLTTTQFAPPPPPAPSLGQTLLGGATTAAGLYGAFTGQNPLAAVGLMGKKEGGPIIKRVSGGLAGLAEIFGKKDDKRDMSMFPDKSDAIQDRVKAEGIRGMVGPGGVGVVVDKDGNVVQTDVPGQQAFIGPDGVGVVVDADDNVIRTDIPPKVQKTIGTGPAGGPIKKEGLASLDKKDKDPVTTTTKTKPELSEFEQNIRTKEDALLKMLAGAEQRQVDRAAAVEKDATKSRYMQLANLGLGIMGATPEKNLLVTASKAAKDSKILENLQAINEKATNAKQDAEDKAFAAKTGLAKEELNVELTREERDQVRKAKAAEKKFKDEQLKLMKAELALKERELELEAVNAGVDAKDYKFLSDEVDKLTSQKGTVKIGNRNIPINSQTEALLPQEYRKQLGNIKSYALRLLQQSGNIDNLIAQNGLDAINNEIDRIYREGFSQIDTQSLGDVSSEGLGANQ